MIYLKIIIALACGGLFCWGGYSWHNARRYLMPLLLTAVCFLLLKFNLWALTILASIIFLSIGYGDKSIFRHVFNNFWGRCVWMGLVAASLSLGLFLTGSIVNYFFYPYVAVCFFSGGLIKDLPQILGDIIYGSLLGSIVFLVH